jgi:hypothetical protein
MGIHSEYLQTHVFSTAMREQHILTMCSYNVNYDLVITLESALMKFSLEMDGVSMGSVEAKFS